MAVSDALRLFVFSNKAAIQDMFDRRGDDDGPVLIDIGESAEIAQSVARLRRLVFKIYDDLPNWQPAA